MDEDANNDAAAVVSEEAKEEVKEGPEAATGAQQAHDQPTSNTGATSKNNQPTAVQSPQSSNAVEEVKKRKELSK